MSSASHNNNTTLIISNYEIEDFIKIVKYLEDADFLLKGMTETFQNEVKEQKGGFISMLLGTLSASLLGDLLTGKGTIATGVSEKTKSMSQGQGIYKAGKSKGIYRTGEGVLRAGYGRPLSSALQNISNNKTDF